MDDKVQEIMTKLKFILKIGKGEKLSVSQNKLMLDSNWVRIQRSIWMPDNRQNTLMYVERILTSVLELLVTDPKREQVLLHDLSESRSGLKNLKITYKDDTYFCCTIDTYLEIIESKLLEYKHKQGEHKQGEHKQKQMEEEQVT